MSLMIGSRVPDFSANTTHGGIRFYEWLGTSWGLLFSHPKDFTPVCTTELAYLARLEPEFAKRRCKIIGLSVDRVADHERWLRDIEEVGGAAVKYPLIGDDTLAVAKPFGMLPADAGSTSEGRSAIANHTVRTVYLIDPDKVIRAVLIYPMTSGRNFDEILRLLDSCQLTARNAVATPANWRRGESVIIAPTICDEEARQRFPQGWKTVMPYMRVVELPQTD